MPSIIHLILGCIPPLAAGPVAGLLYVTILKRGKGWQQILFWALLAALNFLIVVWVINASGRWLPVASLSTFLLTPLAPILSVIVMRRAWHRLGEAERADPVRQRRFVTGLVLIPALQIGFFLALLRYAPWLCKMGLVACKR
jgi:hypothetical protein